MYSSAQRALAGETKRTYIHAMQCAMCWCLQKATAMRPNTIFFLLHFGAKPQNYGFVLACFSLWCNLGAICLSRIAFHIESEKYAVSSPLLKLPGSAVETCRNVEVKCPRGGGGVSELTDRRGCAIFALEVVPKNLILA